MNYREGRWEPSELNGGKLCEAVYTILLGLATGKYPSTASKPGNMVDACHALEKYTAAPRSLKIQIPRMLIALYEIRNNRGVGHIGGDVDPNKMDATCVLYTSKWILCEMVRMFHDVDTTAAEAAVDAITERTVEVVWKVGEKYRILDTSTTMKEKTLLLLFQTSAPLSVEDLFDWTEHPDRSNFRRDVLRPLHAEKFIEYDEAAHRVHLSPKGVVQVETAILPKVSQYAEFRHK